MIEIGVYLSQADFVNNKRKICERVNIDSISMPYEELKRVVRFLYGSGSVIQTVEML